MYYWFQTARLLQCNVLVFWEKVFNDHLFLFKDDTYYMSLFHIWLIKICYKYHTSHRLFPKILEMRTKHLLNFSKKSTNFKISSNLSLAHKTLKSKDIMAKTVSKPSKRLSITAKKSKRSSKESQMEKKKSSDMRKSGKSHTKTVRQQHSHNSFLLLLFLFTKPLLYTQ